MYRKNENGIIEKRDAETGDRIYVNYHPGTVEIFSSKPGEKLFFDANCKKDRMDCRFTNDDSYYNVAAIIAATLYCHISKHYIGQESSSFTLKKN
jgi:hypothetical protein